VSLHSAAVQILCLACYTIQASPVI
jgi:hypothetical protein